MIFSIIIPVYNLEQYIGKLIQSIQNQDFMDYEVILVNDGSTDGSVDIIENLIKNDKRFLLINQENQGPGAARNTGIKSAKGEYLLFFDGDDFLTKKEALSTLHGYAKEDFDIMVYPLQRASNVDLIVHDSNVKYEVVFNGVCHFTDQLEIMLKKGLILSSPCEQMIKRNFLIKNGLYFPVDVFSEDIEWIIRIMKSEPKMKLIDYQFYCYRWDRPGSTCNTQVKSWEKQIKIIEFLYFHYEKLKGKKDLLSELILSYLAYHWCVACSNVSKLEKSFERAAGFAMLEKMEEILKYNQMKKVRVFGYFCKLFTGGSRGIRMAAGVSAFRYKLKRRLLKWRG